MFETSQKVCIAVCTPMPKIMNSAGQAIFDTISPLWHRARSAMAFPTNMNTIEAFADGLEIGVARSQVAALVLGMKPQPEFIFWIDYDVLLPHDALTKLFFRARCFPNHDVYAGVYCLKTTTPEPLIYQELGQGPFWDWAVGDLLTTKQHGIKYIHSGLTLVRTSLYQRMKDQGVVHGDGQNMDDEPFYKTIEEERKVKNGKFILQRGSEDLYFHAKAQKLNPPCQILVDTGVLAGHHDKVTGATYGLPWNDGPAARAKWMTKTGSDISADQSEAGSCEEDVLCGCVNKTPRDPVCPECKGSGTLGKIRLPIKLALDIGAGGSRREWPGHRTYTTDLRADTHPDYVQDTRALNLPGDHYDLVASSHHLEHLGRWDQETVWREMVRITKPGGKHEHVVPSMDWAAWKIKEGQVDEHVANVVLGAQESHGYARELNTHLFFYTKDIAKALAEQAGLVDVSMADWRDDPSLGYNLFLTGRKPLSPVQTNGTCQGLAVCPPQSCNSVEEGAAADPNVA